MLNVNFNIHAIFLVIGIISFHNYSQHYDTVALPSEKYSDTLILSEKRVLYDDGALQSRCQYSQSGVLHGYYESYYKNGLVKEKGEYTQGVKTGSWIYYDESGKVITVEEFDENGVRLLPQKIQNESTPEWRGKRQPKQGLAIYTHDPEVEIVVNNMSYGKHDKVLLELETGDYTVKGEKKGYILDLEKETIEPGAVQKITLSPKRFKFQLSPPLYVALIGKHRFQPGVILASGTIRYTKNNINLYYALGSAKRGHPFDSFDSHLINGTWYYDDTWYRDKMYQLFGLNYTYSLIDLNYLLLSIGAACNVSRFTATKQHSYYDTLNLASVDRAYEYEDNYFCAGPRLSFQAGTKHFRFVSAVNYMIRIDDNTEFLNKRNYISMEHGFVLEF